MLIIMTKYCNWRALLAWLVVLAIPVPVMAQQVDEDELGAWYNYFWNVTPRDNGIGWQGTVQYRNWDLIGDLEQFLVNVGPVFSREGSSIRYAVNYVYVASGAYGSSSATRDEHRLFEEMHIPGKFGDRTYLFNRLRLEQRWIEGQDFRNRFRWFFQANVPVNGTGMGKGAWYASFYNEIFFNLERDIGDGRRVDIFDRNRTYLGVGHSLSERSRVQFGYMYQKSDNIGKGQLQFNLLQWF